MADTGTVRFWDAEGGWGVIDSPATPGGCWAHFSDVATSGYRELVAGQQVELEHEPAHQDGYAHRAVRVWPTGTTPADPPTSGPGSAYESTRTITFDDTPHTPSPH